MKKPCIIKRRTDGPDGPTDSRPRSITRQTNKKNVTSLRILLFMSSTFGRFIPIPTLYQKNSNTNHNSKMCGTKLDFNIFTGTIIYSPSEGGKAVYSFVFGAVSVFHHIFNTFHCVTATNPNSQSLMVPIFERPFFWSSIGCFLSKAIPNR